ncbi:MAG: hypothetical protein COX48_04835 [bacterium (Candidatus Stahlbacteria) CG23_combo_of_CG06-09_8_20_14_all_34_7]|nr:MAG: hypothetical protein COX48_04835 [bacterium (Candidatus Stahlbacteria) CG23_combo_of_CG06-09_8_20_14_all_34_7]
MENDDRGFNKLELNFVIEEFSSNSKLFRTKEKFKNLDYIKNIEEYNNRKSLIELYLANIIPQLSLSDYKIDGVDSSAERIFKVNGQMTIGDITCVSESLRFLCDVNKTDKTFLIDRMKRPLEIEEMKQLSLALAKIIDKEGKIVSNASIELSRIRRDKDLLLGKQQKIINQTLKNYEKMLMEDKITLLDNRIVLQVDVHHKNNVKGVLHAYSNSKKTVFIEPEELVLFNNQITELEQDEEMEIARILESFRERCIKSFSVEISLSEIILEMDFIDSVASYISRNNARFADIGNSIKLKRCFHPIIRKMKREKAVPIDIELKMGDSLMITGPNMGGKTALLKTIGIVSLTAKLGLPIIADEGSEVILFEKVLSDIGDDQSIEEGISTFASHVINYKRFLDESKDNTLILLDEIGTGTSIKEGSAFAISLIKELINKKAVCIFTSHFDSIKEYALSQNNIKCASMKYDYVNNIPYYQIEMDSVGDSGVFNLLAKYGFTESVIEEAKSLLTSNYVNYNEIIKKYKSKLNRVEEQEKSLSLREKAISKIESLINYQKEQTKLRAESIDHNYIKKKDDQIDEFRKKFEGLVKEIRETNASKEKIKEVNEFLYEEAQKNTKIPEKKKIKITSDDKDYRVGDFVVLSSNIEGTIEKIGGEYVSVNVNGVIVNTRIGNIIRRGEKNEQSGIRVTYRDEMTTNEIDIRGMYADDALEAVEKFLLRAQQENLHEVIIIHGHGTGVLKREVRNYLKKQKDIKSYDSGREMSGGDGVTVVKL